MSETDKNQSKGTTTSAGGSANGKAGSAAGTAAKSAGRTAGSAADRAKESGEKAADKAGEKTTGTLAMSTQALTSTVNGVWRKAAVPALGLLKANPVTAGGVAAAAAVAVGAYAGGRRSVRRAHGPVTRLTGGRI
ncbi:hypothetical protein [Streptomyces sp. enrichment culture]|uniref:hypothetical protein n=1 Tax=Streptomyces sp. enrichment culture TaxID=1795815 RepID=UPI003F5673F3